MQVVGGTDLFEDPEAVRYIGYMKAMASPGDDQAVSVALSMNRYGLTDRDIAGLARRRQPKESLQDAVSRLAPLDPARPLVPDVLSFSHLQTYQLCPYRFYLQYLLKLPGRPNRAATFEEFAALAGAGLRDPERVTLEPEQNEPGGEEEVDPLRAFWESDYAQTPPLGSEQEFYLRIGGAVLRSWLRPAGGRRGWWR